MDTKPDFFKDKAREWDKGMTRVNNARKIALGITGKIKLEGSEHLMDFGAGTGLLSEGVAPYVKKITAIDYSGPMLEEFSNKEWPCTIETLNIDLTRADLDYKFDGIISSMTLHHIEDISMLFSKFSAMLNPNGFVALADLSREDGTFHNNNKSVKHFGFDEAFIEEKLKKNAFSRIEFSGVNVIEKEIKGKLKAFPIFLVTAFK